MSWPMPMAASLTRDPRSIHCTTWRKCLSRLLAPLASAAASSANAPSKIISRMRRVSVGASSRWRAQSRVSPSPFSSNSPPLQHRAEMGVRVMPGCVGTLVGDVRQVVAMPRRGRSAILLPLVSALATTPSSGGETRNLEPHPAAFEHGPAALVSRLRLAHPLRCISRCTTAIGPRRDTGGCRASMKIPLGTSPGRDFHAARDTVLIVMRERQSSADAKPRGA